MKLNQIYRLLLLCCIALLPFQSLSFLNETELYKKKYWELQGDYGKSQAKVMELKERLSHMPGSSPEYPLHTQSTLESMIPKTMEAIEKNPTISNFGSKLGNAIEGYFETEFLTERSKMEAIGHAVYKGALWATVPLMSVLLLKGAEAGIEVIKHKLTTPAINILRPETKYGRADRWKRWWKGYKTPPMIFDTSVKKRLEEIETVTKNIRDHIQKGTKKDVKYRNLLLYGKPGTGKTLFATILADKTDMDFLSVSAGDLLQSGAEGKKYFDDLVEMANRSKYGTIIFIDEADGLFIARDELLKAKALDHLVVLNHILGATGSGSNKFMLVAATNNAYSLDPAMGRRFQDRVEMPLPNETTRVELLTLYIKDKLSKSTDLLTPEKIQTIAHRTAGLSHAELSDMVNAMSTKADTNKDGRLTEDNIESAIEEAIEKMKAAEKDRLELERKTQGLPQPIIHKKAMEEPAT